jgi:hypothetical protein
LLQQTLMKIINTVDFRNLVVLWLMARIFMILVVLVPLLLLGQVEPTEISAIKPKHSSNYFSSDYYENDNEGFQKKEQLKFNMQAGAVFGMGSGSGEYFGTYLSPRVHYRLSPKFTVMAGATLLQSFGSPPNSALYETTSGYPSANFTRSFLFASGAYQYNERLIISGTVYKSMNLFNQQNSYSAKKNNDYQGIIMGFDYKMGKHVFIQGQIEFSNYPYSGFSLPYSGFGNGHGNDAFDPFPPD